MGNSDRPWCLAHLSVTSPTQLNPSTEDTELSEWAEESEEEQDDIAEQVKQLDNTVLESQNSQRVDEEVAKLDASVIPGLLIAAEEPVASKPVAQAFDPETPRAPGPVEP